MTGITDHGIGERVKGDVHAIVCGLAALCALYNFGTCVTRPTRRTVFVTLLYVGFVWWEAQQVLRHARDVRSMQ